MNFLNTILSVILITLPCYAVPPREVADASKLYTMIGYNSNPAPDTPWPAGKEFNNEHTGSRFKVVSDVRTGAGGDAAQALLIRQIWPKSEAKCIISVKGSNDWADWLQNIQIVYAPLDPFHGVNYYVHTGFRVHAEQIYWTNEYTKWHADCLADGLPISFTGMSLGGAVAAFLATVQETTAFGTPAIPIHRLITFGAPMLFRGLIGQVCPPNLQKREVAVRVVNTYWSGWGFGVADIVPFQPDLASIATMGIRHCAVAMEPDGTPRDAGFPGSYAVGGIGLLTMDPTMHAPMYQNYDAPLRSMYTNSLEVGTDCFSKCGNKSGWCPNYCGLGRACCSKSDTNPECVFGIPELGDITSTTVAAMTTIQAGNRACINVAPFVTPSPTPSPTPNPTPKPTTPSPTPNPTPYPTKWTPPKARCDPTKKSWTCCTTSNPCTVGEGDCDNDAECEQGLECAPPSGTTLNMGFMEVDTCQKTRCHASKKIWSCCSPSNPCSEGEGDCDSDADCNAGLTCQQPNAGVALNAGIMDIDICAPPATGRRLLSATDHGSA